MFTMPNTSTQKTNDLNKKNLLQARDEILKKTEKKQDSQQNIPKVNTVKPPIQKPIKKEHIQSYFIVFNKKVFTSNVFCDFINS